MAVIKRDEPDAPDICSMVLRAYVGDNESRHRSRRLQISSTPSLVGLCLWLTAYDAAAAYEKGPAHVVTESVEALSLRFRPSFFQARIRRFTQSCEIQQGHLSTSAARSRV